MVSSSHIWQLGWAVGHLVIGIETIVLAATSATSGSRIDTTTFCNGFIMVMGVFLLGFFDGWF